LRTEGELSRAVRLEIRGRLAVITTFITEGRNWATQMRVVGNSPLRKQYGTKVRPGRKGVLQNRQLKKGWYRRAREGKPGVRGGRHLARVGRRERKRINNATGKGLDCIDGIVEKSRASAWPQDLSSAAQKLSKEKENPFDKEEE